MKKVFLYSLRTRYTIGAIVLGVMVIASAFVAHQYGTNIRQQLVENLNIRNEIHEHVSATREAIWTYREALEAFLLDPEKMEFRYQVFDAIQEATLHIGHLSRQTMLFKNENADEINKLLITINSLKENATELIETRIDSEKQYPALGVFRENMFPSHKIFYSTISLAIDEVYDDDIQSEAYQLFLQARYMWTQMVSTYRMYLANRMGNIDKKVLPEQENEVEIYYDEIRILLDQLTRIDQAGNLGPQSSASLEDIKKAVNDWYIGFKKTRRIHSTDEWRADSKILQTKIHPELEIIWNSLLKLENAIESSATNDVTTLSNVTKNQTQLIWIITLLGLLAISLGFLFLERLILRPIATVTQALKAKAMGAEGVDLPAVTSYETRDLVDAYTEMNKQVNARQVDLEYQALHDALTGLPNRTLLLDRLQQAIFNSRREHSQMSLLVMDLNGFKEVNDTVGHHVGDSLLIELGNRLLETIREVDTVARLGGDEFAILLPDAGELRARKVATKVRKALEQVFEVEGFRLYIGASIGIAIYPDHGDRAQTLIQRADVAMYVAKRSKTPHEVYDPQEDQHSVDKLELMSELRNALDTGALNLHYQPKVNISNNEIVGVEALLRWSHPKFGEVPPDEIVAIAEQTGLINPLTDWVVEEAIRQNKQWLNKNLPISVAVNLSVYNLQDLEFAEKIQNLLDKHGLSASYLNMEITESAVMANPKNAIEILTELDMMGVKLAIDDFGTGYSSLGYLKKLPVDELKIDKSFVMNMTTDDNDAIIVRSTIDLAHNLGLKVIAEGVESQEVWDLLEILRCDMAQGYFIEKAMSVSDLEEWVKNHKLYSVNSNVIRFVR